MAERTNLEQYATKMLKEIVVYGEPHADALAVIQKADIFVLNSSYEGLYVLIEALACRRHYYKCWRKQRSNYERRRIIINVGDERFLPQALSLISLEGGSVSIAARKSG